MIAEPPTPSRLPRDLMRCPSVTPAEGGALALIERVLEGRGLRRCIASPSRSPAPIRSKISTRASAPRRRI